MTKGKQGKLNSDSFQLRPKNTCRLCCAQRRRVYISESTISASYSRVFPKKASVNRIFGEDSSKIFSRSLPRKNPRINPEGNVSDN